MNLSVIFYFKVKFWSFYFPTRQIKALYMGFALYIQNKAYSTSENGEFLSVLILFFSIVLPPNLASSFGRTDYFELVIS